MIRDIRERSNESLRMLGLLPALPIIPAPPLQSLPPLPSPLDLSGERETMLRMVQAGLGVSQETLRNVYGVGEPNPDHRYSIFREPFTPSYVTTHANPLAVVRTIIPPEDFVQQIQPVWEDVIRTRERYAQERQREEESRQTFDAMDRVSRECMAEEQPGRLFVNTQAVRRHVELPEFEPTETPMVTIGDIRERRFDLMGRYSMWGHSQPHMEYLPRLPPKVHIFWPTAWEQLLKEDDI
jgi:hypothetical protein